MFNSCSLFILGNSNILLNVILIILYRSFILYRSYIYVLCVINEVKHKINVQKCCNTNNNNKKGIIK